MLWVLLPVRDGAPNLDRALESLRDQTVQPHRVVTIDDGSTDSTPAVLQAWRQRWQAVTALRVPGVGIAAALNAGLSTCLADAACGWIARMDADDVCHPERFARQLDHARREGLALVGCEVRHTGAAPREASTEGMQRHVEWANALHDHDELERGLWVDSPLPHPGWLVRRDAFDRVGRYDSTGTVPEDYEWLHRFFALARRHSAFRAGKPRGMALLDWTESAGRLTRSHPAYRESAFDKVKVAALQAWLDAQGRPRRFEIFGLGPKAKRLLPLLREVGSIEAIVDVNPRRVGAYYHGVEVSSLESWRARPRDTGRLALVCLGTPESRYACEQVLAAEGLVAGRDFLAL